MAGNRPERPSATTSVPRDQAVIRLGHAPMLAVVKADAYGHGAVRVAKTALQLRRRTTWAVATVDEGIKLREGLVNAPILVLLSEPPATAPSRCCSPTRSCRRCTPPSSPSSMPRRPHDSMGLRAPYPPGHQHGHEPHRRTLGRMWSNFMHQIELPSRARAWWARSRTSPRRTARERSTSASRRSATSEADRRAARGGHRPRHRALRELRRRRSAIPHVRFDMVRLGVGALRLAYLSRKPRSIIDLQARP